MPVYEYRCTKGHTYEKTEGFSAPVTQKCTRCSARARRQISMPAVIFKGSGFYSTDNPKTSHGGNGAAAADTTKKADAPSSDGTGDTKSEAKPKTKAETKAEPKSEAKAKD